MLSSRPIFSILVLAALTAPATAAPDEESWAAYHGHLTPPLLDQGALSTNNARHVVMVAVGRERDALWRGLVAAFGSR
jgi:hypothetical protein